MTKPTQTLITMYGKRKGVEGLEEEEERERKLQEVFGIFGISEISEFRKWTNIGGPKFITPEGGGRENCGD